MKLAITPTDRFIRIEGTDHRIWTGEDESGTLVEVAVAYVCPQTHDPERLAAFDRALREIPKLRQSGVIIDYRYCVD